MSTELLSIGAWKRIRAAARASRRRALAAVAYFGQQGARLVALRRGSRLVVDASEHAVRSGQTHPNSLLALLKKGVRVYSVSNLHAKVFVFGNRAYVGSANVSRRSEKVLIEAVIETTEPGTVAAARKFVRDHCLKALGPEELERLQRHYKPPIMPRGRRQRGHSRRVRNRPELPRTWLAQLHLETWNDTDWAIHGPAMKAAKTRRRHPRTWEVDSFRWGGRPRFGRGDVVVTITDEGHGRVMIAPPGSVLDMKSYERRKGVSTFVFLERPKKRRKSIAALARKLGRGSRKRLKRSGRLAAGEFTQNLLGAFET